MTKAGLRPVLQQGNDRLNFANLAYWRTQYADIEGSVAFKDHLYRIKQVRDGYMENLIASGGLDNNGRNHDNELRAVIHVLNTILAYLPAMVEQYDTAASQDRGERVSDAWNPFFKPSKAQAITGSQPYQP
ncbi:MAG: hypothetical protein GY712_04850 [Oceanicoccus sp.]|uniref:hypothetical protein n=1 Tax=Oceanicoccus sp. TaxID=2691044 RepID=UPI002607D606|nr:hypothetical protein [Oceanicoccus sp.]MCP3907327.1 hypothetical protein [Oceanicoccus sp.]